MILNYEWGSFVDSVYVSETIKTDLFAFHKFVEFLKVRKKHFLGYNENGVIIEDISSNTILEENFELSKRVDGLYNLYKTKQSNNIGEELFLFYDLLPDDLKKQLKIYIKKQ